MSFALAERHGGGGSFLTTNKRSVDFTALSLNNFLSGIISHGFISGLDLGRIALLLELAISQFKIIISKKFVQLSDAYREGSEG